MSNQQQQKPQEITEVEKKEKRQVDFSRVNPFFINKPTSPDFVISGTRTICMKPTAKLVDGKPGMAFPDYSDQVQVQKIVDSYAEETGLAYALRQINSGRLLPSQLADKGTGGVDVSNVADNVNDAHRQALESAEEAKKVAAALGVDHIDAKNIEQVVTRILEHKLAAQVAAQKSAETQKTEEVK